MDINILQNMIDDDEIIFFNYAGDLDQTLISAMTEELEKEAEDRDIGMSISNNIFTIFIELTQNMMTYSKSLENEENKAQGLLLISKDSDLNYHIYSQNIVSLQDKEKIEPKLLEIQSLDKDGIKKRYRELRKSGKNTHEKGGGIGFYEIAKRCNSIEYDFTNIQKGRYYFNIKTTIITKKDK